MCEREREREENIPWKSPHFPRMVITSCHSNLFVWVQCYAVDAIVVSFDGSGWLQTPSACEVGTDGLLLGTVVRVARLTRVLVRCLVV